MEANAAGLYTSYKLGNGQTVSRNYDDSTDVLRASKVLNAANQPIQDVSFSFDWVGNLMSRTDNSYDPAKSSALGLAEAFTYDPFNRLLQADLQVGNTTSSKTYAYDDLGNITRKSDFSDVYQYKNSRPHAISKAYARGFDTDENKATQYQYDENGNLSNEIVGGLTVRNVSYFASNLPQTITRYGSPKQQVGFNYDADRLRVKETTGDGSIVSRSIYHLLPQVNDGAHYEKEISAGVSKHLYYLYAAGDLVGRVSKDGQNQTVQYYLTDHLGSVDTIVNDDGSVAERLAYDPFGKRRLFTGADQAGLTSGNTRHGFTGHDHLDEVGLVHMHGRVYDPLSGRFMSADPNVFDAENTQDFNRYSYVHNNPLSATDPTGFNTNYVFSLEIAFGGYNAGGLTPVSDGGLSREYTAPYFTGMPPTYASHLNVGNANFLTNQANTFAQYNVSVQVGRFASNWSNNQVSSTAAGLATATSNVNVAVATGSNSTGALNSATYRSPRPPVSLAGGGSGAAYGRLHAALTPFTLLPSVPGSLFTVLDGTVSMFEGDRLGATIAFGAAFAGTISNAGAIKAGAMALREGATAAKGAGNFASEAKLLGHFEKHGAEFGANSAGEYLQVGQDIMQYGQKVEYLYKGETRTGFVQFMGNRANGQAKFGFVGTNADGAITTIHTESGNSFWKLLNGGLDKTIYPK